MLANYTSVLHTLAISTHFLDLTFATAVGQLGSQGALRHLELSTSGTNFKVDSLKEIMSSCRGLASFTLNDVEGERARRDALIEVAELAGRLDRNTWSMIEVWPETLREVDIRITESANHHSSVYSSSLQTVEPNAQMVHSPPKLHPRPATISAEPSRHTADLPPNGWTALPAERGGCATGAGGLHARANLFGLARRHQGIRRVAADCLSGLVEC